jgi:hypothetical protein
MCKQTCNYSRSIQGCIKSGMKIEFNISNFEFQVWMFWPRVTPICRSLRGNSQIFGTSVLLYLTEGKHHCFLLEAFGGWKAHL